MLPQAWEARRAAQEALPVLLLCGEDPQLADWAIAGIRRQEFDQERIGPGPTQIREAAELARTPSFFGLPRLVIATGVQVLAAQGRVSAKDRDEELEELSRYLRQPDRENRLVLVAPSVDRRRRAYLEFEKAGAVLPCDPPGPKEYEAWFAHVAERLGARVSPAARAAYLRSELDLMALTRALEVGELAAPEGQPVPGDVAAWAAPPSGDLRVFALTDAMLTRHVAAIGPAVENLLRQGESPIGLLALVARQFRLLVRTKAMSRDGAMQDEIARTLGVHPFVARKIVEALGRWPEDAVHAAFAQLLDCDIALKSGAPQAATLELCLVRIAGGGGRPAAAR